MSARGDDPGFQADLVARRARADSPCRRAARDARRRSRQVRRTRRCATGSLRCARRACASTAHSASSSLPGLSRMALLTPSLPMSCSSAARLSQRRCSALNAELLRDHVGEQRDALAVAAGVGALGIDHLARRRPRCRRDSPRRPARSPAPARARRPPACSIVGAKQCPRTQAAPRRARTPLPGRGSNQVPDAVRRFAQRRLGAVRDRGTRRSPAPSARCGHRPGSPRRAGPAACRRRPNARRDSVMPSATASAKRILRAMSAPRWQRVSISSRAISPPFWKMLTMRAEPFGEAGFQAGMAEARSAAPAAGCRRSS